jgi:acyl-CoA synthetase (AMP-forming)/AMP-acid ligase II
VVGQRRDSFVFATAPRARNHQRCLLRAVDRRDLPDAAALRRERRLGLHSRRRPNSVHGGTDNLGKAYRRLGCGFARAPRGPKPGVCPVAFDGIGIGGAAGEHSSSAGKKSAAIPYWSDGMTEIGMALSNPLRGERVPGSVGRPLPGVEVQLVGENGEPVAPGIAGEIEVRGRTVFAEYWGKPEATCTAFRDGWFRTGDTAVIKNGVYRILGRTNIDILKTGGHKIFALEIEEALREHPAVSECAVVGLPDAEWGERVAAAVVLNDGDSLDLSSLRTWARDSLAPHKLPSRLLVLDALPRNAMGKVMKPSVVALFQAAGDAEAVA